MRSSFYHRVDDQNYVGEDSHDNCDQIDGIDSEIYDGIDGI